VQPIAIFLPAVADADERIHIRDEDVLGPRAMTESYAVTPNAALP